MPKGRVSLNERIRTPAKRASGEKHMPQSEKFEALVLGSGTGGKLIAWYMAQSGRQTAVVERRWVGGSCPNIACMPSKNEISSAKVAHLLRRLRWSALRRREPTTHFRRDWCALFRRSSDQGFRNERRAGDRTAAETFVRNECSRESRKHRQFR